METTAIITGALLGGLLAGLPLGYWAGYWHGRADGRLAERTRFLVRDIRRAELARRQAAARRAEPWYQEVTPKHAAVIVPRQGGWDMPEHTDWTGPQQALGTPESDPDGLGRFAAVMIP